MKRKYDFKRSLNSVGALLLVALLLFTGMPVSAFADEVVGTDEVTVEPTEEPAEEPENTSAEVPEDASEGAPEIAMVEEEYVTTETAISDSDNVPSEEELLQQYIDNLAFGGQESNDIVQPGKPKLKASRRTKLNGAELNAYNLIKAKVSEIASGDETVAKITFTFAEVFPQEVLETRYTAADLGYDEIIVFDSEQNKYVFASGDVKDAVNSQYELDINKVVDALLFDCPYDLYWYDRSSLGTKGRRSSSVGAVYDIETEEWKAYCSPESTFTFAFGVSENYRAGEIGITYESWDFGDSNNPNIQIIETDSTKTAAASKAVATAQAVVDANADFSDYDKLVAYKDYICGEVSYNDAAADDNNNVPYGNPWQLIWVFDGDASTNVVCEGYSKAFKFLCDLTEFDNKSIEAHIVTGEMDGGKGAGGHMWNLVTIDQENYLVDVTNCDIGTIGYSDKLFMVGNDSLEDTTATETVQDEEMTFDTEKYTFPITSNGSTKNIGYIYDYDTVSLYSRDERLLATSNYEPKQLIDIASATITGLEDKNYTGTAITQTPTVTLTVNDETITLIEGTDYELSYENNVEVGTATMTVSGIGDYTGTVSVTFTIAEAETLDSPTDLAWADNEDGTKYATWKGVDGAEQYLVRINRNGEYYTAISVSANSWPDSDTAGTQYGDTVKNSFSYSINNGGPATYTFTVQAIKGRSPNFVRSEIVESEEYKYVADISAAEVTGVVDKTYTGDYIAQTPTVIFTVNDKPITLVEGTDYELTYANNVNVGTATMTITGINNYAETKKVSFEINPASITNVTTTPASYTYDGQSKTPSFVVKAGNLTVPASDYTAVIKDEDGNVITDPVNAGTYTVEATGKGYYTGTGIGSFEIEAADIEDAVVEGIVDHCMGNVALENMRVTFGLKVLEEEKDYKVLSVASQYTADVQIQGINNYKGVKVVQYNIIHDWSEWQLAKAPNCTEIGYETRECSRNEFHTDTREIPAIGHSYGEPIYTWSTDNKSITATRVCSRDSNHQETEEGEVTAKVTKQPTYEVKGKTTYTATFENSAFKRQTKTVEDIPKLEKNDISSATVSGLSNKTYTGKAITQSPTVKVGNTTLKSGTDYSVGYKNNTNAGTATVTITGKGNYTGTKTATFKINPAKVTIPTGKTFTYNGKSQTGVTAAANYTVSGNTGTNAKSYTATAKLKDKTNYTWSDGKTEDKKVTWKINPLSLAKATVTGVEDKLYTGKAITQTPTVTLNDKTLKSGTDYTLSYKNNTKAGTATMTVTGKGNYSGTVNKTFSIIAKSKIWERIAGQSGFDTMAAITKKFGTAKNAVIAANTDFKDSLAAAGLAGSLNAPMMLTNPGGLPNQTRDELKRMGVTTVYLVGSTKDVSAATETQIKNLGIKVVRITGSTPSQKAINVAKKQPERSDTVIIATPSGFQDALSISPYAYATKSPVLYSENNKKLSTATVNYIKSAKFKKAIIVGGYLALPLDIEDQLKGVGISASNITRLAGANGYATSQVIAEWGQGKLKNGTGTNGQGKGTKDLYFYAMIKYQPSVRMTANNVGISRGDKGPNNWRDALAGAALCGKNRAILLLVHDENTSNAAVTKASKAQIAHGYVFGGELAVGKKSWNALVNSTK